MATITTAWELWTRQCRVAGQGLAEGATYVITALDWKIYSDDMITTSGSVTDEDGNNIDIKNIHIAFDLDDIIGDVLGV
jgi:hypothetical protein